MVKLGSRLDVFTVLIHIKLQDLDDENIIETVDFSEFERLFEVKKSKRQRITKQDNSKQMGSAI